MNDKLLIGWGETDITPDTDVPVALSGQYYARTATGIHSRLKTTVCVMSSGAEHFVTGSIDNVGCSYEFHQLLRQSIVKQIPEIDPEKIFFNAIHSHSAPSVALKITRTQAWRKAEDGTLSAEEYAPFVIEKITRAVVGAWKSRAEGGIARAFGSARIGHCRRAAYSDGTAEMYGDTTREDFVGMEAGEDSGVEMLFTFDRAGKRTGMFLNVACPSQCMESTYEISSDFAGATRELLKEEFGPEFRTIYQISPAGCQSPRDLVRHYAGETPDFWHADGVVVLAGRLRDAVEKAVLSEVDYAPVLKHKTLKVALPRRRASYAAFRAAEAELARLTAIMPEQEAFEAFCTETHANEKIPNRPGPYDSKLHHFVLIKNAQAVIDRYHDQDEDSLLHFNMNVVRIGDAAIANNPFELYLLFGQIIKARSRAPQTFLVQLSGGADKPAGYLPSPEAEKLGGYGGLIINGQVGSDGGHQLADLTVEAINSLFDAR